MNWTVLLGAVQFFFAVVIGMYFFNLLRNQQNSKVVVQKESAKEMEKLRKMRGISLTEPLSEKTRPASFGEIIGQEDGIRALRAALCGTNPQHVLIYGPPGVGKTAAARLVLDEAKQNPSSPFRQEAKMTELDATTARFDERGIADPLIGSVHDPIYQGAGAMGQAGVPQPKPGAVTKAHGGLLFIEEIGELHPIQMNKLLKVLEDRKVYLESAYYNDEDKNVPSHIHDVFQNGLPADFRLIGATTRTPQEIPPAIRSRCVEIYFRPLSISQIVTVARHAIAKLDIAADEDVPKVISQYAQNGREAVNIVQIAAGLAATEEKGRLTRADVEWVVHNSQLTPRPDQNSRVEPRAGLISGLAVFGPNMGVVMDIEVTAMPAGNGQGNLRITGIIDEEEMESGQRRLKRRSMSHSAIENVMTVLKLHTDVNPYDYDIHVNFPGGTPIDGPSAGIAMATAMYSAIRDIPVDHRIAMTGELSIHGQVKPVGGVVAKVQAAKEAGLNKVLIPWENWQSIFDEIEGIRVLSVEHIHQAFEESLLGAWNTEEKEVAASPASQLLSAASAAVYHSSAEQADH